MIRWQIDPGILLRSGTSATAYRPPLRLSKPSAHQSNQGGTDPDASPLLDELIQSGYQYRPTGVIKVSTTRASPVPNEMR